MHCPGKKHANADSLSRMPCSQCELPPEEDSKDHERVLAMTESWMPSWTSEELVSHQRQDPGLKQVIAWLETRSIPKILPTNASSQIKALYGHSVII